jgi:hypothetical protein
METIGDDGHAVNLNAVPDPSGYAPAGPLEHKPPGGYAQPEVRQRAFAAALAGIELGAYDRRIISWLVGWDDPTCRTLVSLLWRARQAGEAAGPPGTAAALASLASWIGDRLGDETADRQAIAEDAAAQLRDLAGGLRAAGTPAARAIAPGSVTLDAGQAQIVLLALADAAAARRAGGWCHDCLTGDFSDHAPDEGRAVEYEALTRHLITTTEPEGGSHAN